MTHWYTFVWKIEETHMPTWVRKLSTKLVGLVKLCWLLRHFAWSCVKTCWNHQRSFRVLKNPDIEVWPNPTSLEGLGTWPSQYWIRICPTTRHSQNLYEPRIPKFEQNRTENPLIFLTAGCLERPSYLSHSFPGILSPFDSFRLRPIVLNSPGFRKAEVCWKWSVACGWTERWPFRKPSTRRPSARPWPALPWTSRMRRTRSALSGR